MDPFHAHQARWFSDGDPTALVKDGQHESKDPPPKDSWNGPLTPLEGEPVAGGQDLRRVEDRDDGKSVNRAVWDVLDQTMPSF